MEFTMKDVANEGFEIVEEIIDAWVTTPVDLNSVSRININDFNYGTYYIIDDEQSINTDSSETLFSLYRKGENILMSVDLEEIKEYLNNYFKSKDD